MRYSNTMRPIRLLMACSLLCGCQRTPANAPSLEERPPLKQERPDLFKVSDSVFDRYGKLGYEKLTWPEKVFVCVWGLEGEVNNGGFDQYYFNSSGDHAARRGSITGSNWCQAHRDFGSASQHAFR